MPWHNVFFFSALGFVLGVVSGGLALSFLAAFLISIVFIGLGLWLRIKLSAVVLLAIFLLFGNFYYSLDDYNYHLKKSLITDARYFEGIVVEEPQKRADRQAAKIKSEEGITILAHLNPYPEISYGDILRIFGEIDSPPNGSYGRYLAKERVHGTIFYPEIEVIGKNPDKFFGGLYSLKKKSSDSINRLFSYQQGAFLNGILFGDREEFSKEFLDQLSFSGTLHLTALSGSNMTIIVFAAFPIFLRLFRYKRRQAFFATFATMALFVAMTGFDVSAMRAAAMAFVVATAEQASRIYNSRNSITLAALVLSLMNPKMPVFDLGFQLSFIAVMSIVYFVPVLKRFSFFKNDSYLGWREVLAITAAAQIGVAPISMAQFANFSFSAFPANLVVIVAMPALMAFGFLTVFASFIFWPFAVLLSKPTAFLLDYSIGAVEIFSDLRVPFNPELNTAVIIAYYAFLIYACAKWSPKVKNFFS